MFKVVVEKIQRFENHSLNNIFNTHLNGQIRIFNVTCNMITLPLS